MLFNWVGEQLIPINWNSYAFQQKQSENAVMNQLDWALNSYTFADMTGLPFQLACMSNDLASLMSVFDHIKTCQFYCVVKQKTFYQ